MSNKLLLLALVLFLGFGGYKLIANKSHQPEPAVASESQATAPEAAVAPPPAEAPVAKPPVVKEVLPPKVSLRDLTQRFRVNGFGTGAVEKIVMINNTALHEGETYDDLRIEKIRPTAVEVFYRGHSYELGRQLLPNSNF